MWFFLCFYVWQNLFGSLCFFPLAIFECWVCFSAWTWFFLRPISVNFFCYFCFFFLANKNHIFGIGVFPKEQQTIFFDILVSFPVYSFVLVCLCLCLFVGFFALCHFESPCFVPLPLLSIEPWFAVLKVMLSERWSGVIVFSKHMVAFPSVEIDPWVDLESANHSCSWLCVKVWFGPLITQPQWDFDFFFGRHPAFRLPAFQHPSTIVLYQGFWISLGCWFHPTQHWVLHLWQP